MARIKDKDRAIQLRLKGYSYSQIKEKLGISKSTLSGWLEPYPLSRERIRELRYVSPRRIESFRQTMAKKKHDRLDKVYEKAKKDIGKLSRREIMLGGLFLYWGEGYKTATATTAVANTDPAMLKFFVEWLKEIKAPMEKLKVKIHIYRDMNKDKTIDFWRKELDLPQSCFGQVYVKNSKLSGLSYKNGFGHGTCNILVRNRDLNEYVLSALKYLRTELS